MSTIAAERPRTRPLRPKPWAIVLGITIAAAAAGIYALHDAILPFPAFQGACERLRSSGLPITSADWFCQPVPWSDRAAFVVATFLIGVGYALPSAILASTGRRLAAFAPLLLVPAALGHLSAIDWLGPGAAVMTSRVALFMVSLGAPVAAVCVVARHRRTTHARPRLVPGIGAAVACAAASFGVLVVGRRIMSDHFASLGGAPFGYSYIMPAVIAIAVFAMVLGTDRRWWPWSIAPVALLLSMGPSVALVVGRERILDWSQFGAVAPLVAIGLVWSVWRPMSLRLTRFIHGMTISAGEEQHRVAGRLRPIVAANAFAVSLVVVSLIAFRADPLPFQIGTVLPTFLGERTSVDDLRARMNLRSAMTAMDAYRDRTGSYRGFDEKIGAATQPSLAWFDGLPRDGAATDDQVLQVSIVAASEHRAKVAALSASGNAFCLQRGTGGLTYGKGVDDSQEYGSPMIATLQDAVRNCGSTPWTAAAVRPFPIATMCDGMAPYDGYLICRMVQALSIRTIREPNPA